MSSKVTFTRQAREDLLDIWAYIAPRKFPATTAGVTNKLWEIGDITVRVEASGAQPSKCGFYNEMTYAPQA